MRIRQVSDRKVEIITGEQFNRRPRIEQDFIVPETGFPFLNDSEETVPAHGVVQVKGTENVGGKLVFKITKPNDEPTTDLYLVNASREVKQGAYGRSADLPAYALWSPTFSPPLNLTVGAKEGEWKLTTFVTLPPFLQGSAGSRSGLITLSTLKEGKVLVGPSMMQVAGGISTGITDFEIGTSYTLLKNRMQTVPVAAFNLAVQEWRAANPPSQPDEILPYFKILRKGVYYVEHHANSFRVTGSGSTLTVAIHKNGLPVADLTTVVSFPNSNFHPQFINGLVECEVGDLIDVRGMMNSTTTVRTHHSSTVIHRVGELWPNTVAQPTWITVRNDSDETAPAHAPLRVTGAELLDNRTIVTVDKPDDSSTQVVLINGPREIESEGYGQATTDAVKAKATDSLSAVPEFGEKWGPGESWELEKDKPGALALENDFFMPTSLGRTYASLFGSGSYSLSPTFAKVTMDPAEVEPLGLTIADSTITLLRDGTYYTHFRCAATVNGVSADTPDTCSPEAALYVNGERYHDHVASRHRLRTGIVRHLAFAALIDGKGGDVLEVRTGIAGNESQAVTITGSPTGGTFTLTFDGQTTGGIAWNANAAAVQSALEALSNIAPGDVTVVASITGGSLPTFAMWVEFKGTYAGVNVPQMTATSFLTGGVMPAVTVTTNSPLSDTINIDHATWTVLGLCGPTPVDE